jgi:hypothetical protein
MAKNLSPFICDICGVSKSPSNRWFCAWVEPLAQNADEVRIKKWADELAEKNGVQHICGIDCASRWCVRELAKIYGN